MTVDGEGITTLIAGAGCPLSCKYCINKEILRHMPEMVTPEELYYRLKIDDLSFQATGGGVTFGGGESLLHSDFIASFRQVCGASWRIYAETSLAVPEENILAAANCIDGFIVDIKTLNPDIYLAYTGKPGDRAFENLKLLRSLVGQERILVRVPLIPGFNTQEDQARTECLLRQQGFRRIDVFNYVLRDNMQ